MVVDGPFFLYPFVMAPRKKSMQQRLLEGIEKTDTCWTWKGSLTRGYGQLGYRVEGKIHFVRVHRLSWEIHNGPIPDGMLVCHSCDNRACVRPDHLFLGSHADNTQDMVMKMRHIAAINKNRTLTDDQVREVRDLLGQRRLTQKEIGRIYGVSQATVHKIATGQTWEWLK